MSDPAGPVVCYGEVLLRLSAPGATRLLQTAVLETHVGGAEANVAVSLAQFGHPVRLASTVPDNALGTHAEGFLRAHRVEPLLTRVTGGRLGLYFLEHGAVSRPARIVYDRAGSAFATEPGLTGALAALEGARLLHLSGITPAVSRAAGEVALAAAQAARAAGVSVCFDGNYRSQLWQARGENGVGVLSRLVAEADVALLSERDISLLLGVQGMDRATAWAAAFDRWPRLRLLAATTRHLSGASTQSLQGELATRQGTWRSPRWELNGVVDRIGAGDAFAAGLLHGELSGWEAQATVDFATASAVLKHAIPGDANLSTADEVLDLVAGGGLDVRR